MLRKVQLNAVAVHGDPYLDPGLGGAGSVQQYRQAQQDAQAQRRQADVLGQIIKDIEGEFAPVAPDQGRQHPLLLA